jgi:hypothetical protein
MTLPLVVLWIAVQAPPEDWAHGSHLSGEWGGARTWLDDHGVTLDLNSR